MKSLSILFAVVIACVLVVCADANNDLVIGGQAARRGQFPHLVALRTFLFVPLCGGAILNKRWILTAAHCTEVFFNRPELLVVAAGAHTKFDGIIYRLETIISHPEYNTPPYNNDIAVLRTAREIEFIDGLVQPGRLPTTNVADGTVAVIAGWGLFENSAAGPRFPATLQYQNTTIISLAECRRRLSADEELIQDSVLCTLTPEGQGVCSADSGSPLIINDGTIVGITNWAVAPCASDSPDAYARVYSQLGFIRNATGISE